VSTYVGMFSDLGQHVVGEGTGVAPQATWDIVRVLETDQGLNLVHPAGRVGFADGLLTALLQTSHRGAVDVRHPVVVASGRVMAHILLEDDDVVVGDLVLDRGGGRDQRCGALLDDSGVKDGRGDRDRDGGEEGEERGSQGDLHAGR